MTRYEFYIVESGRVRLLRKEEWYILASWYTRVYNEKERRYFNTRKHEAIKIQVFPKDLKIGNCESPPRDRFYGKTPARLYTDEEREARNHPETLPLLDVPFPFRYD